MSKLYNILDELCKKKGITGYRMAKACGVSPSLMSDLKSGRKKTIQAETANRLAAFFSVSVAYIMGEAEADGATPIVLDKFTQGIYDLSDELYESDKTLLLDLTSRIAAKNRLIGKKSEDES